jgi:hypothetical protein
MLARRSMQRLRLRYAAVVKAASRRECESMMSRREIEGREVELPAGTVEVLKPPRLPYFALLCLCSMHMRATGGSSCLLAGGWHALQPDTGGVRESASVVLGTSLLILAPAVISWSPDDSADPMVEPTPSSHAVRQTFHRPPSRHTSSVSIVVVSLSARTEKLPVVATPGITGHPISHIRDNLRSLLSIFPIAYKSVNYIITYTPPPTMASGSSTPKPTDQSESFSKMSTGDVEAIGAHCQMPFCRQLDLLPFRCESCKG